MHRFQRILLAVFLGLAGCVQAQSAAEALQQAEAQFLALSSYTASVGYTMGGHHDVGKVYYAGKNYRYEYPEDQTICDGKAIMIYSMAYGAVNILDITHEPDYSLGGVYGLYQFPFEIVWTDTMFAVKHLHLTALDDNIQAKSIDIGISKKTGRVSEYNLEFRNGLKISYVVIEEAVNPVLDPNLFVIDWEFVRKADNGEIAPIEEDH